jgi:hypothetical protein
MAVALALAGCGASPPDDAASIPLQGFTTTTPPPPTTPPTQTELERQLLDDYRSDWAAIMHAYLGSSVVGLHRYSAGPLLYGVSDEILHGVRSGLVWSATMSHHPLVQSMDAEWASVHDCILLEDAVVDSLSEDLLGEGQGWVELVVDLLNDDGTWKLFDFEVLGYDCQPPAPQV